MYVEVLRSIEGIEIFPVISLVLFVTVFVAMLVWALRLRPERLRDMAAMPLDGAGVGRPRPMTIVEGGVAGDAEAR